MARALDPPPCLRVPEKEGCTDEAALKSLLLELHKRIQQVLQGFGQDYVKCFDFDSLANRSTHGH